MAAEFLCFGLVGFKKVGWFGLAEVVVPWVYR